MNKKTIITALVALVAMSADAQRLNKDVERMQYVYDPAEHDGVAFEDLPDDWVCPRCKRPKDKFNKA